jgi:hypothetical protein
VPLTLTPAAPRTLSDLDDTSIKLFLFGDAFAEHSKEYEGSLVCLLAPKVSSSEGAHSGGGPGFSLSIDKSGQLFKLGTAADFGLCKGERKDGKPCSMAVNTHVCEYCKYHAAAALKALDSRPPGRMDASGSARAMTERRKLMQAAGKGAGVHYAAPPGNSDWRQGPRPKPLASTEELKRVAECVGVALCTRPLSCVPCATLTPHSITPRRRSKLGRINSQGSRQLAQLAVTGGAPGTYPAPPPLGRPLVQAQPGSVQARMRTTGMSSLPRNASGLHPPPGGQGAKQMVMMDVDAHASPAEVQEAIERAIQTSRDRGGFKVPDAGGPRQRVAWSQVPTPMPVRLGSAGRSSAPAHAHAHAAAPRALTTAAAAPLRRQPAAAPGGKRSFTEVFGAVTAGMEDGESLHADLAEDDVEADLMRTLDYLSKREGLTQAAEKVTCITVQAWKCACGSLTERQRPECASQGHGGRVLPVKKRFWSCRSCKWRAVTLDSTYPLRGCTHCGGSDFDKTPLGGPPKKVDVNDGLACREALKPRGEEHAFSLKSLR